MNGEITSIIFNRLFREVVLSVYLHRQHIEGYVLGTFLFGKISKLAFAKFSNTVFPLSTSL